MRRTLCVVALVAAGFAAVPAHAVDVRKCVFDHNSIPDPEYGGHAGPLDPVGTVNCIHPIAP
jgi:hypothetical protein